ncbi:MAG: response regulator [Desulfatiglans sp.]|jgi:DNA-binding NtrC family response regulator|nr:response regulator [Desulfatiglans sp.]
MSGQKRVLVVEDEMLIRTLLLEVLSDNGFEVSLARDGEESLEQLGTNSFDLVITDIQMPGVDGIKMLKEMKKADRKEKIIVMSADPSDMGLNEPDMPHVVSRLQKPFRIDNFLDVVIAATAGNEDLFESRPMEEAC